MDRLAPGSLAGIKGWSLVPLAPHHRRGMAAGRPSADLKGVSVKAWQPWTEEEDEDLARRHNDGDSITVLSQEFQRTYGAIRARLIKQGRIAP